MRQLQNMVAGRQLIEWDHTAAICATVINMHRDPKKSKPADAVKMNPYRRESARSAAKIRLDSKNSMKLLKGVFIDHKLPSDLMDLLKT